MHRSRMPTPCCWMTLLGLVLLAAFANASVNNTIYDILSGNLPKPELQIGEPTIANTKDQTCPSPGSERAIFRPISIKDRYHNISAPCYRIVGMPDAAFDTALAVAEAVLKQYPSRFIFDNYTVGPSEWHVLQTKLETLFPGYSIVSPVVVKGCSERSMELVGSVVEFDHLMAPLMSHARSNLQTSTVLLMFSPFLVSTLVSIF